MNTNYERFSSADTAGVMLDLDPDVFKNWIIKSLLDKKVEYIITKGKADPIIMPVKVISDYFDITAQYRIKRSGSSNPAQKDIKDIKDILIKNNIEQHHIERTGKNLYLKTPDDVANKKLSGEHSYLFKTVKNDKYRIRRLSETSNRNVIFSIRLKEKDAITDQRIQADRKTFEENIFSL